MRNKNSTPKRPGRPKSEAKKRQINRAAIELFIRHGYEGTTMDRVAETANVSKQTVYSHFESKEELFSAAVQQLCDAMGLPSDPDAEERPLPVLLAGIGRGFLRLLTSDEAVRLYRIVVGNATNHPDVARMFYETGPRTFIRRMAALLAQRAARGELAVHNPELAAAQFFSMMRGELHMRVALGMQARLKPKEIDNYVDDCVAVFLRGHSG